MKNKIYNLIMNNKVFIIYHNEKLIKDIINYINKVNNDVLIAKKFISSNDFGDSSHYFLNQKEVGLALKNNSLLYVLTDEYISSGITIDDFYNCDIFLLSYKEYNAIADIIFTKYPVLSVWVDSKTSDKAMFDSDFYYEIQYLEKRLETVLNEYYLDDDPSVIGDAILNYLNKDKE